MSYFLYKIKYTYIFLEKELRIVMRDIKDTQESNHMLSAEISYLNNPKNIELLAKKHLNMVHVKQNNCSGYIKKEKTIKEDLVSTQKKNMSEEKQLKQNKNDNKNLEEDPMEKFLREQV